MQQSETLHEIIRTIITDYMISKVEAYAIKKAHESERPEDSIQVVLGKFKEYHNQRNACVGLCMDCQIEDRREIQIVIHDFNLDMPKGFVANVRKGFLGEEKTMSVKSFILKAKLARFHVPDGWGYTRFDNLVIA